MIAVNRKNTESVVRKLMMFYFVKCDHTAEVKHCRYKLHSFENFRSVDVELVIPSGAV